MKDFDLITEKLGRLPKQSKKMFLRQLIVASVLFIFLAYTYSLALGLSLLIGFGAVLGGFVLSFPIAKINIKGQPASSVIVNIIKAELVKLIFIIVVLWLGFKFYTDIQPFGLVLGLAISALMSGLAISKLDKLN
ncbi:MAG: ATP synthase subunit I [Proteobacteria bacterium]|nr:ATP synthase subunit I [Pseudomonadota bacterium]MDA0942317.1 ATP synthase subunit I [Pseudomonadota bacterium]MDA1034899.1 ATP synthase subunit I [Pseudomonadota bacterium]